MKETRQNKPKFHSNNIGNENGRREGERENEGEREKEGERESTVHTIPLLPGACSRGDYRMGEGL